VIGSGAALRLTGSTVLIALTNMLLFLYIIVVNSIYDQPVDRRSPHRAKRDLVRGVCLLGQSTTFAVLWVEAGALVVLASVLAWRLHQPLFVVVVLLDMLTYLLYNVEPVRLKRRGWWNPFCNALILGFFPPLLAAFAQPTTLSPPQWLLILGATLFACGGGCWSCVADREEDAEAGLLTPAVRYGPAFCLRCAGWLQAAAALSFGLGLGFLFGLPWALAGGAGCLALGVERMLLTRRVLRENAPQLLSERSVRLRDELWQMAALVALTVPGLTRLFS
jgi:4-hydroxybenzoate polyprenyltransferase